MAKRFAGAWLALVLGCASPPMTGSGEAMDWRTAAEPWSIQLVTRDADGASRTTRMRVVALDGSGFVRTGESGWGQNLERDPSCQLHLKGKDHRLRAEAVTSAADKQRIDAAFLAKYGWQERLFQALWVGEVRFFRLQADRPGSSDRLSPDASLSD